MICAIRLLLEVTNRELHSCAMSCVDKDWQHFIDTSALPEGLSHVPVCLNTDVRCNLCFNRHYLLYNMVEVVMCLLSLALT